MNEDSYTKQQIFSAAKTSFYRKMSSRTSMAREEKSALNSKLQIIVVIILQDTYISNHHTVYLELTKLHVNFFSMTLERKIKCRGKFQKNLKKKQTLIIQAD